MECPTWPTPRITPYPRSPHFPKPSGLRQVPPFAQEKARKKGASKKIPTRGEKAGVQVSANKDQATSKVYFKAAKKKNHSKKKQASKGQATNLSSFFFGGAPAIKIKCTHRYQIPRQKKAFPPVVNFSSTTNSNVH